ncbi:LysM peptidoglycan-binding domain-containing protein [Streptomonospora sp. S1-112]|uniref:LysM peptidoglycan-binding domain-containing protein n=1 Tax=Streptomonospora mangrovi TaxID=2883123 RepID=A0A9X3NJP7_9ACTN|nr:LysM peptidoglycan-binding domain-containing protein [Streptomonospora mangrovi]MDA0564997.1 LysM peptidoglycan-binding domain-containing protein [Streptomonospora mangrovi]
MAEAPARADREDRPGRGDRPAGAPTTEPFDWAREIPEWRGRPEPRPVRRPRAEAPAPRPDVQRPAAQRPDAAQGAALAPAVSLWRHRLTRRGRVVVVASASVLATALLSAAFMAATTAGAAASNTATDSVLNGSAPGTVVVREGDTLWEIAERVRPGDDPRRIVHEIVRVNGLDESTLEPGQELLMPEF